MRSEQAEKELVAKVRELSGLEVKQLPIDITHEVDGTPIIQVVIVLNDAEPMDATTWKKLAPAKDYIFDYFTALHEDAYPNFKVMREADYLKEQAKLGD